MTHSRTRRNMHVPAWQVRKMPRTFIKPSCSHRRRATVELGGDVVEVCCSCGVVVRQVRA